MTKKNYILHFNGRTKGAIGTFHNYRFEGDFESHRAFMDALYNEYEHIRAGTFYIDGEIADYSEVSTKVYTEAK